VLNSFFRDHRFEFEVTSEVLPGVRRGECDTGTLQPEQEVRIASEAIELGDHQGRLRHTAFGQRPGELRAIVALAALDLDKLRQRRDVEAGKVAGDRGTLRPMPSPEQPCLSVETGGRKRSCCPCSFPRS
jgi:hypothetical protein